LQRYIPHFPAAGEILVLDRSWYNRAGVEYVMEGCRWLGLVPDAARNAAGSGRISADTSRVSAWVIPTDEERMVAQHTCALLGLTRDKQDGKAKART